VWKFSSTAREVGFSWQAQLAFNALNLPGQLKALQQMVLYTDTKVRIDMQYESNTPLVPVGEVEELTPNILDIPDIAESFSVKFSGTLPGTVGRMSIRYREGGQV
jgi:hypothetical protein